MTRHTRSASCGHCTGPKVFIVDFLPYFSFLKRKKFIFFTKCFPFEDSLKCFIQACVARVCMKYISCWCMLTFCSYQYLIEISMYWKVRSAWAWFKSKWIFSKKKPNNNQPQCFFKDLIDSKDKCECKNGIPRLGWLKGSSLKKDLEHLCFWSSSLRPGQEESCVMCACWAMPKKKKKHSAKSWHHMVWNWRQKCMSDVRTDGVVVLMALDVWVCVRALLFAPMRARLRKRLVPCPVCALCVPSRFPARLPRVRSGWPHARGLE